MTMSFRAVRIWGIALAVLSGGSWSGSAWALPGAPPHVLISRDQLGSVSPMIVAGDPAGVPTDNPGLRVDPNTTTSPYAGVGSLFIDAAPVGDNQGFLCSGCCDPWLLDRQDGGSQLRSGGRALPGFLRRHGRREQRHWRRHPRCGAAECDVLLELRRQPHVPDRRPRKFICFRIGTDSTTSTVRKVRASTTTWR